MELKRWYKEFRIEWKLTEMEPLDSHAERSMLADINIEVGFNFVPRSLYGAVNLLPAHHPTGDINWFIMESKITQTRA